MMTIMMEMTKIIDDYDDDNDETVTMMTTMMKMTRTMIMTVRR